MIGRFGKIIVLAVGWPVAIALYKEELIRHLLRSIARPSTSMFNAQFNKDSGIQ